MSVAIPHSGVNCEAETKFLQSLTLIPTAYRPALNLQIHLTVIPAQAGNHFEPRACSAPETNRLRNQSPQKPIASETNRLRNQSPQKPMDPGLRWEDNWTFGAIGYETLLAII